MWSGGVKGDDKEAPEVESFVVCRKDDVTDPGVSIQGERIILSVVEIESGKERRDVKSFCEVALTNTGSLHRYANLILK